MMVLSQIEHKKKVTIVSASVNVRLGVGKIIFGLIARSEALVADGIHSFSDVLVHTDPEDDEQCVYHGKLPLRLELMEKLQACWQGIEAAQKIQKVNFHYSAGSVEVEVFLLLPEPDDYPAIELTEQQLSSRASAADFVSSVRVYYTGRSCGKIIKRTKSMHAH